MTAGGGHSEFWTAEFTAALRERWELGYTAAAIALSMGCSRSAVLGKASRIGLRRSAEFKAEVLKRASQAGGATMKARAKPKPVKVSKPLPNPVVAADAPAKKWQVPFIKAGVDQCRFPLWQVAERTGLVCGAPSDGKTLCAFHRKVCWVSPVRTR